jgi:hypothetical protein
MILNSEMKTTDFTDSTDREELAKSGLFLQQVKSTSPAIHEKSVPICETCGSNFPF